jgi:flavodoxin I
MKKTEKIRVLVLYDSIHGNTEQVAKTIHRVVVNANLDSALVKITENTQLNFDDYDLIFCGSPVIEWLPTTTLMSFIKAKLKEHRAKKDVLPCAPLKTGKFAVCFGTYCGAHIGVKEATPMTEWLAAFFWHIGYLVIDKLHLPGQMRRADIDKAIEQENNIEGIFGNIMGRPNQNDLQAVETFTIGILRHIGALS